LSALKAVILSGDGFYVAWKSRSRRQKLSRPHPKTKIIGREEDNFRNPRKK